MRVAFVLRALPPYRLPFLRRFVDSYPALDVAVITGGNAGEQGKLETEKVAQPFPVFLVSGRVWEPWKYTVVWLHGVIERLKALRADVVILEGNFGILSQTVTAAWARLTGRRVIFWVAGWQKPWVTGLALTLREAFMRMVVPLGHHFVCYSTASAAMLRRLGVPANRVSVAQNTIDTEAIAAAEPALRQEAARHRLALGIGDRPTLVYVGAITKDKHVERLIELHVELRRRGLDLHTVIVGDGPAKRDLEAKAAGIDSVHLLGRVVSGVDAWFAVGDVFVLPGLGGLAINQAMANCLPVLCTHADGTERDLVVDGETGYFRAAYSLPEWADLLEGLLRDPIRRGLMAEAARARVLAIATLTQMCRVFESAVRNGVVANAPREHRPAIANAPAGAAPFSVLISTHAGERAAFLAAALGSCVDQVIVPDQVVLVVDGPVGPDQEAVIASYRIRAAAAGVDVQVVRLEQQGGLPNAMNAGLPHCRCEYVARMDSDDISAPSRFAAQWAVLRARPEIDLLASWQADFESDPSAVFRVKTVPALHEDIVRTLRWRNAVPHPSVVFRKSMVQKIGGYRPIRYLEDYDLFMRLADAGAMFSGIQQPLIRVRVTDAQRFRRGGWRYALDEFRFRVGLYRQGSISLANLCLSGPAYLAFRLAPVWLKRSLYGVVRREPVAMPPVHARELPSQPQELAGGTGSNALRPLRLAAAQRAAAALWHVRGGPTEIGRRVPVLCYHRVMPGLVEDHVPAYNLAPERFAAHLRWLREEGFTTLTLPEYEMMALGMAPVPERAVLISCDDGYADFRAFAQPIAAAEGARINLFLCTGLPAGDDPRVYEVHSRRMAEHRALHPELWRGLSWAEVRQVRDAGVSLGYHSHFHESYGHLTDVATRADIDRGLTYWRREIGTLPTAFAFPKGGYGTYPDTAVAMLRGAGFSTLFSTYLGRTELPAPEAILGRLVILQHDDLDIFRQKVFGAFDWLGRPRELDQALRKSLGR